MAPAQKPKRQIKPQSKKTLKIVGAALGLILLAGAGAQAYFELSGDYDWDVYRGIIQKATQIRNSLPGCCLPQCEHQKKDICTQMAGNDWFPASCNKLEACKWGCCQIKCGGCTKECTVEQLPRAVCLHTDGSQWNEGACEMGCCWFGEETEQLPQFTCETCVSDSSWTPGKCKKGYSVRMTGSTEGEGQIGDFFGASGYGVDALIKSFYGKGTSFKTEWTIDAYTCDKSIFSEWNGKETKTTHVSLPNGETSESTKTEDETFFLKKEGSEISGSLLNASLTISQKVEGKKIIRTVKSSFVPSFTIEGTITKGANECEKKPEIFQKNQ